MVGEHLTKAMEWFNKAVGFEQSGKISFMEKCLTNAINKEKEGIAAGESWD